MYKVINEGIDHINIYSRSTLLLGRQLSNFYYSPFKHPLYGEFLSMEGFYFWYLTGQVYDDLKQMYGYKAKEYGNKLEPYRIDKLYGLDSDMIYDIKEAIIYKLAYNPDIYEGLKNSTLKFTHYYVYNGKEKYARNSKWFIDIFEDIRSVLK